MTTIESTADEMFFRVIAAVINHAAEELRQAAGATGKIALPLPRLP